MLYIVGNILCEFDMQLTPSPPFVKGMEASPSRVPSALVSLAHPPFAYCLRLLFVYIHVVHSLLVFYLYSIAFGYEISLVNICV